MAKASPHGSAAIVSLAWRPDRDAPAELLSSGQDRRLIVRDMPGAAIPHSMR